MPSAKVKCDVCGTYGPLGGLVKYYQVHSDSGQMFRVGIECRDIIEIVISRPYMSWYELEERIRLITPPFPD